MTLSLKVNDVNEIPANFVPYTIHVNENEKDAKCCLQSDNTKCNPDEVIGGAGAAATLDPDQDQSLKYEFTVASDCDDGGASLHTDLFKIDESSGLIKTKEALDFEKTATYTLRVKAKDTGTPAQEKCVEVTVAVVDIDEAPTVTDAMDKDITVDENKNKDDTDATVFTTEGEDLDAGDKDLANQNIKYEIHAGNDDGYFGINADTGIVSVVVAKGNIDYEDVSKYELTIRTSDKDDSELYTDENIKVTVNDANENPEIDNDEDDDGKDKSLPPKSDTTIKELLMLMCKQIFTSCQHLPITSVGTIDQMADVMVSYFLVPTLESAMGDSFSWTGSAAHLKVISDIVRGYSGIIIGLLGSVVFLFWIFTLQLIT